MSARRSAYGSIRRLPSGRYQVRITVEGHKVAAGTFATRREAGAALAHPTPPQPAPAAPEPILAEWAEQWWLTRSGHRVSTRSRDRLALDRYVLPALGDRRLGSITATDVSAWVAELSTGLAPASVRRVHVVLAQLLRAAVDAGLLASSPAQRVRLPRAEAPEARFLTPGELEGLAQVVGTRWRALVLTLAWATLRIGEACGLRQEDLDVDAGTIRVARSITEVSGRLIEGPPKTAAGRRTMALPASVLEELAAHLDAVGLRRYVFGSEAGRPLRPSEWRRHVWRPAVEAAGLAPLRVHDLKHSGVAFLIAAGVDPKEIARRAGHSSVAFTYSQYGHLFPELDRDAAAKLDALRLGTVYTPPVARQWHERPRRPDPATSSVPVTSENGPHRSRRSGSTGSTPHALGCRRTPSG